MALRVAPASAVVSREAGRGRHRLGAFRCAPDRPPVQAQRSRQRSAPPCRVPRARAVRAGRLPTRSIAGRSCARLRASRSSSLASRRSTRGAARLARPPGQCACAGPAVMCATKLTIGAYCLVGPGAVSSPEAVRPRGVAPPLTPDTVRPRPAREEPAEPAPTCSREGLGPRPEKSRRAGPAFGVLPFPLPWGRTGRPARPPRRLGQRDLRRSTSRSMSASVISRSNQ